MRRRPRDDDAARVEERREPPPELVVEEVARTGEDMRVRARLRSRRGATIGALYVPSQRLVSARIDGTEVPLRPVADRPMDQGLEHATLPAAGAVYDLVFRDHASVYVYVVDTRLGLGDAAAPLLRARPDSAVPIGRGDRSVVWAPVDIPAAP
jgi:hypothetical protein